MNWKDNFSEKFYDSLRNRRQFHFVEQDLREFIETEIIEKLIEEAASYFRDDYGMVAELRAKWLGKEQS
jgi:hypothetical protein